MAGQIIVGWVRWAHDHRRKINAWIVRVVSAYFGYKVLSHEIYEVDKADPLLIFLGLWLCGIAPATFFDGIKKVGVDAKSELERVTGEMSESVPGSERESDEK
jgi:hypothetical protein